MLAKAPSDIHYARITRRQTLANEYIAAAEHLSRASLDNDFGCAATNLSVLAFEILLKAVFFAETGMLRPKNGNGHNYIDFWRLIPETARDSILADAKERDPTHTHFNDMDALLQKFQKVFSRGRYDYERNDERTLEEAHEIGLRWIDRGAPMHEADLEIPANEIFCLNFALGRYIDRLISVG